MQDLFEFLRHKDMFAEYILPRIIHPRSDWDNHSDNDEGPVSSLEACRVICEKDTKCLQYAFNLEGRCVTTSRPNLGESSRGMESGWMYNRMQDFHDKADSCGNEEWIV